ncbi:MAG: ATP-binding protein [Polyangiaceae bacterium]
MIRSMGRTELRVIAALLVVGLLPLLSAMWLADQVVSRVGSTAFQPEFAAHLDRSLELYAELVQSMKGEMRARGAAIAADPALREAAVEGDRARVEERLAALAEEHPGLLAAKVTSDDEDVGGWRRSSPLDEAVERPFTVARPLGEESALEAVFAAPRARIDQMTEAQDFVQSWKAFADEHRGELLERPYLNVFALLLGITVLLAVLTGVLLVRPSIRRINQLAAATGPVAKGDLDVRVEVEGSDEIADLARAFNHMLEELGQSRARVEFLKRIGEWQNMARRLAHEIKNPLTPIQLAVEECTSRYDGDDPRYRALLDTTLDIVREEVASLRRLVTEFAGFARLPRADLRPGDLAEFFRDQLPRLLKDVGDDDEEPDVTLDLAEGAMPVALDRTMFYRVIQNLVQNGLQASAVAAAVRITVRPAGEGFAVEVADDGPGIDEAVAGQVFDPYVTTKEDGTGLGLTIVKKIVIDHGGHIEVGRSEALGGAKFTIFLPAAGTDASSVALAQSEAAPVTG